MPIQRKQLSWLGLALSLGLGVAGLGGCGDDTTRADLGVPDASGTVSDLTVLRDLRGAEGGSGDGGTGDGGTGDGGTADM